MNSELGAPVSAGYRDIRVTKGIAVMVGFVVFIASTLVQGVFAPMFVSWWQKDPDADLKTLTKIVSQNAQTISIYQKLQEQQEKETEHRFDFMHNQIVSNKADVEKLNDRLDALILKRGAYIFPPRGEKPGIVMSWAFVCPSKVPSQHLRSVHYERLEAIQGFGKAAREKRDLEKQLQTLVNACVCSDRRAERVPMASPGFGCRAGRNGPVSAYSFASAIRDSQYGAGGSRGGRS